MAGNPIVGILGRRLRLGVVGGGGEALIGPVHRIAARLDDCFEIKAGALSSSPERSRAQAQELALPRAYDDLAAMIDVERTLDDGIDAVAIMTPNDSHFTLASQALEAGLHVICDKPLTNTLEEARGLVAKVRDSGCVFCLTHNYSGYPMVRQARAMVQAGELGRITLVHVVYAQGTLGAPIDPDPSKLPARLRWRLDPAKGGVSHVLGDIGTHAHQLACFMTGRNVRRVMADLGSVFPGREVHDNANVLMELDDGVKGLLWATKAATGAENALAIEIYGEKGGLFWEQSNLQQLRVMRPNQGATILSRGLPELHPAAKRAARIPPGHPEGFHEAFANLYRDFAETVAARLAGRNADPLASDFPTVEDGARGLAFIEACVRSSAAKQWVDCPPI